MNPPTRPVPASQTIAPPTAPPRRRSRHALLATALALALAGCGGKIPGLYRIDIQQGNVLEQEQLAKLERGMEKRKVQFILGTPLLTDAFNQDCWDYYYSYEEGSGDKVQRRISVLFENERLVKVTGDVSAASGPIELPARKEELVKVPEGLVDDGILAGLVPDFFSDRPKRIERRKPEPGTPEAGQSAVASDAGQTPGPATGEGAAQEPVNVQVSESETAALAGLLAGYGRGGDVEAAAAAMPAPPPPRSGAADEEREEGVFSRWARQLGLKGEEGSETAPPGEPQLPVSQFPEN